MPIERLTPTVATLYAELLRQCEMAEASRHVGALDGSFVEKVLSGKRYVYLQYAEAGKQKQKYVGEAGSSMDEFIQTFRRKQSVIEDDRQTREKLAAMLRQGGAYVPDGVTAKILELIADSGIFALGAVLVGSHAFVVLGNVLGVRWPEATRTQDIDIAQDTCVSLALAREVGEIDLPQILARANMGFLPVPGFDLRHPSTSFKIRGRETHIDLLVPEQRRGETKPVFLKSLNAAAQPLKWLDYLLENTIYAVVPVFAGIQLKIPDPARFAIHKLAVAFARPVQQHVKMLKDLRQAELIFEVLEEDRYGDILLAAETANIFGRKSLAKMSGAVKKLKISDRSKKAIVKMWL